MDIYFTLLALTIQVIEAIGCAIRYIKPSMKQLSGDLSLVTLVSGVDDYGHFTKSERPNGRLNEEDFERC